MNQKNIIFILILLIAVFGGWWFLTNKAGIPTLQNGELPAEKNFSIEIREKKIISGPTTVKVNQGDLVKISLVADEEEEFHVHGYDLSVDLEPGISVVLAFLAKDSGRFMFELEESKTEIGAIEILPR